MMAHQGQSYPSPLAPSLIGMNTAQAAAAAVRTSVGPQTEGTFHHLITTCTALHENFRCQQVLFSFWISGRTCSSFLNQVNCATIRIS